MRDKSKLTAIILVIITIVVVVISFFTKTSEQNQVGDINIVTNYSNFYTVDSCLYRTVTYMSSKDKESLYLILSDNYKKENNISEENVIDVIGTVGENSTFITKKMYYQDINDNITKYYVYGIIQENYLFEEETVKELEYIDKYFIVYLDTTNKTFSIEPYSKELFEKLGGDSNEG
ncbi:MAG: hypothetical protein IJY25_05180 [Bacilli bacterium]|nr:hypothetical protein [Bacilli bacterium]